jgi:hypothetical protein
VSRRRRRDPGYPQPSEAGVLTGWERSQCLGVGLSGGVLLDSGAAPRDPGSLPSDSSRVSHAVSAGERGNDSRGCQENVFEAYRGTIHALARARRVRKRSSSPSEARQLSPCRPCLGRVRAMAKEARPAWHLIACRPSEWSASSCTRLSPTAAASRCGLRTVDRRNTSIGTICEPSAAAGDPHPRAGAGGGQGVGAGGRRLRGE